MAAPGGVATIAGLEITLQPAAAISGRVMDHSVGRSRGRKSAFWVDPLGQELRYDFASPGTLDLQASQLRPSAKTDGDGRFEVDGLPCDALLTVMVAHDDFDREFLHVATTNEPQPDLAITPRTDAKLAKIHPAHLTVALGPAPRIAGQVVAADTNRLIAGARIEGTSDERWFYATADDQGHFVLRDVRGLKCRLRVEAPDGSPYLGQIVLVDVPKKKAGVSVAIKLVRGELLQGTTVAGVTGQGVPGVRVTFDAGLDWNHLKNGTLLPGQGKTDAAGRFQLVVPPGKGKVVIAGPAPGFDLPRYTGRPQDLVPEFAKEVEVVHGEATPEVKFALRREGAPIPDAGRAGSGVVTGRVVDSAGMPVAGAEVAPSILAPDPRRGPPSRN